MHDTPAAFELKHSTLHETQHRPQHQGISSRCAHYLSSTTGGFVCLFVVNSRKNHQQHPAPVQWSLDVHACRHHHSGGRTTSRMCVDETMTSKSQRLLTCYYTHLKTTHYPTIFHTRPGFVIASLLAYGSPGCRH